MRLVLMQFLTLDGVCQGPGAPDEDTSDGFTRGGWLTPHIDDDFLRTVTGWVSGADAFLFGRRTYDAFARDWPQIDESQDPFAVTMNGRPKYVASHRPVTADWAPTTVLSGDTVARVAEVARQPGRELQIHGSARLAHSLLTAGLIDEVRLVVAPVVVGSGRRLFTPTDAPVGLRLRQTTTTAGGLVCQTYERTESARFATYVPAR